MHPPNLRSPAPPKPSDRPALWLLCLLLSASPILLLGCADATSRVRQFFGSTPAAAPSESATPSPTPTPAPTAAVSQPHAHKKSAPETHIAIEKPPQVEGKAPAANAGSGNGIVTLEASPIPSAAGTSGGLLTTNEASGPTPSAQPKSTAILKSTATANLPVMASSGEPNPADAAKLIDDVDKVEKRIDRNNLSADESQRDVLAQRMLQDAKNALADRDNVAAISLATKASTLLAPLPKTSGSSSPSIH